MNIKEKLLNIENLDKKKGAISVSKNPESTYYSIRCEIYENTKFLDDIECNCSDRIYAILNDITEIPKCGCGCGNNVLKIKSKYLPGHGNKSSKVKEKKKESILGKYGVENVSQLDSVKEKKLQTSIDNFGGHHMKTRYSKYKESINNTYGVDNIFQLEDVKDRCKEYCEEHKEDIISKRKRTQKDSI